MSRNKTVAVVLIGAFAGIAGYYVNELSGLLSALGVIFALGWLLYRFSSPKNAWNTLGFFSNPGTAALIIALGVFTYFSLLGNPFEFSVNLALGMAALGAVLGMFIHKYWSA